jgi:hypothetical protein
MKGQCCGRSDTGLIVCDIHPSNVSFMEVRDSAERIKIGVAYMVKNLLLLRIRVATQIDFHFIKWFAAL